MMYRMSIGAIDKSAPACIYVDFCNGSVVEVTPSRPPPCKLASSVEMVGTAEMNIEELK